MCIKAFMLRLGRTRNVFSRLPLLHVPNASQWKVLLFHIQEVSSQTPEIWAPRCELQRHLSVTLHNSCLRRMSD